MPSVGDDYRPAVTVINVSLKWLLLVILIIVLAVGLGVYWLTQYGSWLGATYGGRPVTVITDPDGLYQVDITAVPGSWQGCWVDVAVVLPQGVKLNGPVQRFTTPFGDGVSVTKFAVTLSKGLETRSVTFETGYPGPFENSPVKIYGFREIFVKSVDG
jgi:hypothetical protein